MSLKIAADDGSLVPARNLPGELFEEFDRLDDDEILAELRGAVVEEYVYEFPQNGQTVVGLSLPGVMAVAQRMGGITCGPPVWDRSNPDEITCDISATDHKVGLTVWGTSTEPVTQQTKQGPRPDKFARAKALSKAQRNAIRKLIPEAVATKMVKLFREQGRGRDVRPPTGRPSRPVAPHQEPPSLPASAPIDAAVSAQPPAAKPAAKPDLPRLPRNATEFWHLARPARILTRQQLTELLGEDVTTTPETDWGALWERTEQAIQRRDHPETATATTAVTETTATSNDDLQSFAGWDDEKEGARL